MSVKYLNWAFQVEGLSPTKKIILISLADNANDEGQCFPSTKTICNRTGINSRTTLTKHIKELCKLGMISIENRQRNNGSQTSNMYQLNIAFEEITPCPNNEQGPENEQGVVQLVEHPEPPFKPSIEKTNKKENQLSIAKPKQEIAQNSELGSFETALAQYSALAKKYGLRIPRVVSAANEAKARKTIKALEVIGVDWVEYLRIIARSPHLLGKNDRNWKATFDWIINPTNVEKIVNGNYEQDRPSGPPTENEKWQRRMIGLRDKGLWLDSWGDKPGVDGCQVPPHVLAQFGRDMAVIA